MAIYAKWEGINGSVTTKGYEKWSEIEMLNWGIDRDIKVGVRGGTRESSEPAVSEVVISKRLDTASGKLVEESFNGKATPRVEFAFTRTERDQVETFLKIRLDNCLISAYRFIGAPDGEGGPRETISVNYIKLEVNYAVPGPDGAVHDRYISGFDLLKMQTF